jgi:hypothetical protein
MIFAAFVLGMVGALGCVYIGYRMGRDTVVIEAPARLVDPKPDRDSGDVEGGDWIGDEVKDYDDPDVRIKLL